MLSILPLSTMSTTKIDAAIPNNKPKEENLVAQLLRLKLSFPKLIFFSPAAIKNAEPKKEIGQLIQQLETFRQQNSNPGA